jgi:hypothetical protein
MPALVLCPICNRVAARRGGLWRCEPCELDFHELVPTRTPIATGTATRSNLPSDPKKEATRGGAHVASEMARCSLHASGQGSPTSFFTKDDRHDSV